MITLQRILVAVDLGESSDSALRYAYELATTYKARLDVLHVLDVRSSDVLTAELLDDQDIWRRELEAHTRHRLGLSKGEPPEVDIHYVVVAAPDPGRAIATYVRSEPVDLVVMGTHGRGRVAHLIMGSVAEHIVRWAPCPVLTVRTGDRTAVAHAEAPAR